MKRKGRCRLHGYTLLLINELWRETHEWVMDEKRQRQMERQRESKRKGEGQRSRNNEIDSERQTHTEGKRKRGKLCWLKLQNIRGLFIYLPSICSLIARTVQKPSAVPNTTYSLFISHCSTGRESMCVCVLDEKSAVKSWEMSVWVIVQYIRIRCSETENSSNFSQWLNFSRVLTETNTTDQQIEFFQHRWKTKGKCTPVIAVTIVTQTSRSLLNLGILSISCSMTFLRFF